MMWQSRIVGIGKIVLCDIPCCTTVHAGFSWRRKHFLHIEEAVWVIACALPYDCIRLVPPMIAMQLCHMHCAVTSDLGCLAWLLPGAHPTQTFDRVRFRLHRCLYLGLVPFSASLHGHAAWPAFLGHSRNACVEMQHPIMGHPFKSSSAEGVGFDPSPCTQLLCGPRRPAAFRGAPGAAALAVGAGIVRPHGAAPTSLGCAALPSYPFLSC